MTGVPTLLRYGTVRMHLPLFVYVFIYLVSYLFNRALNIEYFCNVKRRFCVIFVSASEVGGGGMFQSRPGEDDVHRGLRNTALLSSLNKSSTFQHFFPQQFHYINII